MYKASIRVTLRPSILDPQGKATRHALMNLGHGAVSDVRIGKYLELIIEEDDEHRALDIANEACRKLLANPVMEDFAVTLEKLEAKV
jgi:phosphoribosylformylglycinamidine synthase subunit PurS